MEKLESVYPIWNGVALTAEQRKVFDHLQDKFNNTLKITAESRKDKGASEEGLSVFAHNIATEAIWFLMENGYFKE